MVCVIDQQQPPGTAQRVKRVRVGNRHPALHPGLDYYKTAPNRNPKGPETGTQKAFRGGGWMDSTTTMRAAMRNGTDPKTKINWMGFRCAQDAKEDTGAKVSMTKE